MKALQLNFLNSVYCLAFFPYTLAPRPLEQCLLVFPKPYTLNPIPFFFSR